MGVSRALVEVSAAVYAGKNKEGFTAMKQTIVSKCRIGAVAVLLLAAQEVCAAPFNINLNFTGGLTPAEQAVFTQAANAWESLLPAYQPGINIASLTINASSTFIDGPGGILGQSGPSLGGIRHQGGYWLSTGGTMQFDTADMQSMESTGSFLSVVEHEMAHVMGFGTLWTLNGVYINGSGRYTGANAVAAASVEFGRPGLTFVPVELNGGSGTANSHWAERSGGQCCTGFTNSQGQDATFELMTGWLNMPTFISQTTIQSFVDIGYMAAVAVAIPEPESYVMLFAGLFVIGFAVRRRRR
jgi:hypothetical protein